MGVGTEVVLVPSADLLVRQVTGCFQFGDDTLRRSFGDPHLVSKVTKANTRGLGDQDQDAGMVRKERPCT